MEPAFTALEYSKFGLFQEFPKDFLNIWKEKKINDAVS